MPLLRSATAGGLILFAVLLPSALRSQTDSAYRAMQARGAHVMGVDQMQATHHFTDLPDGGRIVLEMNQNDSAGVAMIRMHLQHIAKAFAKGDFSDPQVVHDTTVPGTDVLTARRAHIRYVYEPRRRGGAVRIITRDPQALQAVRSFLAFQRAEHHASQ